MELRTEPPELQEDHRERRPNCGIYHSTQRPDSLGTGHPPVQTSTPPLTRSAATIQVIARAITSQHHVQNQLCVALVVDGVQGGTWPQIHLLGTAALERFTGYTGQSRSRHATHTWNVTRLPEIDHGGVLADQRTAEREVLDALRRQPDSGFAIQDAPGRVQRLLTERTELRALLQRRPPDRRPAFHQAELALESAKKELYWAHYRLDHARERLDQLGRLSQLRSHGRKEKASTVDQIERFTDDVCKAEAKIAGCERAVEDLRPELDRRLRWDVDHMFPDSRLRTVDAELADLGQSPHQDLSREASLLRRSPGMDQPAWLDGLAEVSPPPLPGRDLGAGMDLGL